MRPSGLQVSQKGLSREGREERNDEKIEVSVTMLESSLAPKETPFWGIWQKIGSGKLRAPVVVPARGDPRKLVLWIF